MAELSPNGSSRYHARSSATIEPIGAEHQFVVVGTERLGDVPRMLELVVIAFGESNRKRLDTVPVAMLAISGDDGARIDAAAEKRADRHVADAGAARPTR